MPNIFYFTIKGAIYCVTIAAVISSCVQNIKFSHESSPGISLVLI